MAGESQPRLSLFVRAGLVVVFPDRPSSAEPSVGNKFLSQI